MKYKNIKELLKQAVAPYVTDAEAEYFAEEVAETDVRKPPHEKYSEGIIADIQTWKNKVGEIKKVIDLPGFSKYDFGGLGPALKIKTIHDDLIAKADQNGISMVSIVNSGGMHTMHLWTQGLAKKGYFAFATWNGGPDAVVPLNGTRGLLGTNPLTYGFPGDKGDIVVDMATSEIPYFKVVGAKKHKDTLPINTAVDSEGEVTTDAEKALDNNGVSNLLPMGGGYKGYNINYLTEIMTSALIGARASSQMSDAYIETEHGGIIVVAIDKVTERSAYDESMKSLNEEIRDQKPRAGIGRVTVPGDRNLEHKNSLTDESEVVVDTEYLEKLNALIRP